MTRQLAIAGSADEGQTGIRFTLFRSKHPASDPLLTKTFRLDAEGEKFLNKLLERDDE